MVCSSVQKYNITLIENPVPFVWFRVAKTGTRTVFKVLRQSSVTFKIENGHQLPLPKCSFRDYFEFTFVRNPYDRLISGWTDKVINGGSGGGIAKVKSPARLMNFDYFVDWLTDQNPTEINIHYRPQTLLVPLQVNFIGRTESIEQDLRFILQKVGLEPVRSIPRENCSGPKRLSLKDISIKTLDSIHKLYIHDFERFDYPIFGNSYGSVDGVDAPS